ncbi:MAG: alpha-E domain-containing protein [Caldilineaceae bacterium]|nr:alpha-E domain-containing protein [Caldilineaceae bacterium]
MLSRAADSLYWLSRYLERAEKTTRLIYNHVHLMLGQSTAAADDQWRRLFAMLHVDPPILGADSEDADFRRIYHLTYERDNFNSIRSCIGAARENARQVREQISSEMWEQINRLYLEINRTDLRSIWQEQPHEFFRHIENEICLFRGVTSSTMQHDEGWGFLQLGMYLERAQSTATLLDVHYGQGNFELSLPQTVDYLRGIGLLRSCLSFEAYCRVYTPTVTPTNAAEFLILNPSLPRSLRFCADHLQQSLQQIDASSENRRADRVLRLTGRLQARLRYGQIDEIIADSLHVYLTDVMRQCDQIHSAIYQAYIEYAIEGEFAA